MPLAEAIDTSPVKAAFERTPNVSEITTTVSGTRVAIRDLGGGLYRFFLGDQLTPKKIITVSPTGTITRVETPGPVVSAEPTPGDYQEVRDAVNQLSKN